MGEHQVCDGPLCLPGLWREAGRWEPTCFSVNSARVGRKRPQEVPACDHPAGRMPARLGQHDKENPGCGGHGHPHNSSRWPRARPVCRARSTSSCQAWRGRPLSGRLLRGQHWGLKFLEASRVGSDSLSTGSPVTPLSHLRLSVSPSQQDTGDGHPNLSPGHVCNVLSSPHAQLTCLQWRP